MSATTDRLSSRPPLKRLLPIAALVGGCAALAFEHFQASVQPLQPGEVHIVKGFISRTGDPALIAAYNAAVADGELSSAEAEELIESAKAAPPIFLLAIPPKK